MRHFIVILVQVTASAVALAQTAPTVRYIAPNGEDTGECTQISSPCASPAYGVSKLQPGDTLMVREGTYVLTTRLVPPQDGLMDYRTVIMAYPGEAPVFDGRNLTYAPDSISWTRVGATNVWSTAWNGDWTLAVTGTAPTGRIEASEEEYYRYLWTVGSDELPLRYWNTCSPGTTSLPSGMPAGYLCVLDNNDDNHGSPETVYVRLRDSSNPNSATIRMSTLGCHFNCAANGQTAQRSRLHIKGLHLKYAATNAGGIIVLGPGSGGAHIVEDNTIEWSNFFNVNVGGSDNIIRNNTLQHGGRGNIGGNNLRDSKIYGNTSGRMNWKGFRTGNGAGNKFIGGRRNVIRNNTINSPGPFDASFNGDASNEIGDEYQADGLWFDEQFSSNTVYANRIDSTWRTGIFVEISDSNYVFSNVITRHVSQSTSGDGNRMAINVAGGKRNLIAYNTIMGSDGCIKMQTYSRGSAETDVLSGNLFINNVCLNNDWGNYAVNLTRKNGDTGMTDAILAGNVLEANAYGAADSTINFFRYKPAGAQQLYFLKSATGAANFSGWKSDRSYDASSLIIKQGSPHVVDISNVTDGWRLANGSQLAGQAIAIQDTSWWDSSVLALDADGNSRPNFGGDLGAHQLSKPEYYLQSGDTVVIEAEKYHSRVNRAGKSWTLKNHTGNVGSSMRPEPLDLTSINSDYKFTSPELVYRIEFSTPDTYYVWVRAWGDDGDNDSWHVGLDGEEVASADRMTIGSGFGAWRWRDRTMDSERATLEITSSGEHSIHIWMREDGVYIDRFLLTTDATFIPTGIGPDESSSGTIIGESGRKEFSQMDASQWHTVDLLNRYDSPVVVMGPLSFSDNDPSTLRVRNVTPSSFEFQIDEWDYLDGVHATDTVFYLVVEEGEHVLGTGALLKAGYATRNSTFSAVAFPHSFTSSPVVLSQVTTVNDTKAVVTRHRNVSTTSFDLKLQSQESSESHANETVGWVALEPSAGTAGAKRYEAAIATPTVSHNWTTLAFAEPFLATPAYVAAMQGYAGGNPATLRYDALSGSNVRLKVEEEQSADLETNHGGEVVAYAAFELGTIYTEGGGGSSKNGGGNVVADDDLPQSFDLRGNYPNPFNPVTTIEYDLPFAVEVRLEVFNLLGQRLAVLVEDEQPAGTHRVVFHADEVASGVYFYRLQAGSFSKVSTMVVLK